MQVQGHSVKEEAKKYQSESVQTKVNKVMEFLINQGSSEAAIQEKLIRGLIRLLHSSNSIEASAAITQKMGATNNSLEVTTSALKFIFVCQRVMLYCPHLFSA